MKQAFTMVELIFVIVIIGILSAIAVPKLMATRDDAYVSAVAKAVTDGVNEVAAYALSRGMPSSDLPAMSNIIKGLIRQNKAVFNDNVLSIKMNTIQDCVKLTVSSSDQDMNLSLAYGDAGSDRLCLDLQKIIDAADYSMAIGGQTVVR